MRHRLWTGTLLGLMALLIVLVGIVYALRLRIADAQSEPSATIELDADSVPQGEEIVAVITFQNLTISSEANLGYRSDVTIRAGGSDADDCEGWGMGFDHSLISVDQSTVLVAATTSEECPSGAYRLQVRLWDADDVELASASADFEVTVPTATPTPTPTQAATPTPTPTSRFDGFSGWRGEYYDNPDLAGEPVLVRDDANVDINWGSAGPDAAVVPADNFSVRWERIMSFGEEGIYRFRLWKNDGVRVWFDDQLIIDHWQDYEQNREFYVEVPITAGAHFVRIEYYDKEGDNWINFRWERRGSLPTSTPTPTLTATTPPPLADFSGWRGEYYANRDLAGAPALVRDDPTIDFDWGTGSPADGVPADHFSVRWERVVSFDAGLYRFSVLRNDGARVWIDDRRIINEYYDSGDLTFSADVQLLSGNHTIRVEFVEFTNTARIEFWWAQLPAPTATATPTLTPTATATRPLADYNGWRAEYYANQDLAGEPVLVRDLDQAHFDLNWGGNRPANGVPADYFSVRWERIVTFDGGLNRFFLRKDNGARVWVDGQLILDHWHDCCFSHTYSAELPLIAGDHTVRVEFFERHSEARIKFWWEVIGPLPLSTPTPAPAVWSATMTVGGGGGYAGYGLDTGGSLSDSDFSWQGTTYTVEAILHNPFSDTVSVEFSEDIGAELGNLPLCLGATQLDMAQARSPNDRQFFWDNVDPAWNDGDTVSVGLNGCGG